MARPRKKADSNGAGPLAILSSADRAEYARRLDLTQRKQLELSASEAYLDALGEDFRERYGLPEAYNLNLQTGEVSTRGR